MSLKKALFASLAVGLASMAMAWRPSEVKFYDETLPSSLNPLYAESMVDYRAQELYFDRLYYNDPVTNELTSRIVNRWELASQTALRLHLKPGLKWHNGEAVTAADICFTIDAMLNKKTTSKRARLFREFFKGCTAEQDLVARVEYTKSFISPLQN